MPNRTSWNPSYSQPGFHWQRRRSCSQRLVRTCSISVYSPHRRQPIALEVRMPIGARVVFVVLMIGLRCHGVRARRNSYYTIFTPRRWGTCAGRRSRPRRRWRSKLVCITPSKCSTWTPAVVRPTAVCVILPVIRYQVSHGEHLKTFMHLSWIRYAHQLPRGSGIVTTVEGKAIRPGTDSRLTLPIVDEVDQLEHDHNAEEQYKKGGTPREFDTTFCENPRVKNN